MPTEIVNFTNGVNDILSNNISSDLSKFLINLDKDAKINNWIFHEATNNINTTVDATFTLEFEEYINLPDLYTTISIGKVSSNLINNTAPNLFNIKRNNNDITENLRDNLEKIFFDTLKDLSNTYKALHSIGIKNFKILNNTISTDNNNVIRGMCLIHNELLNIDIAIFISSKDYEKPKSISYYEDGYIEDGYFMTSDDVFIPQP